MSASIPNISRLASYAVQNIPNPCKGCQERYPACHDECPQRAEYLQKCKAERDKVWKKYKTQRDLDEAQIENFVARKLKRQKYKRDTRRNTGR